MKPAVSMRFCPAIVHTPVEGREGEDISASRMIHGRAGSRILRLQFSHMQFSSHTSAVRDLLENLSANGSVRVNCIVRSQLLAHVASK